MNHIYEIFIEATQTALSILAFLAVLFLIVMCITVLVVDIRDCGGIRNFIMQKFDFEEEEESIYEQTDK